MNRPLPPGDRGYRGPDPGRASGPGRLMLGAGGLVGRTAATDHQEAIEAARVCLVCPRRGSVAQPAAEAATWGNRGATLAFLMRDLASQMGADSGRW